METKTVAKAHRMPGPVKRSAIRPTLALKGKIQSQVKLETVVVLVSENNGCGYNSRTKGWYLSG